MVLSLILFKVISGIFNSLSPKVCPVNFCTACPHVYNKELVESSTSPKVKSPLLEVVPLFARTLNSTIFSNVFP